MSTIETVICTLNEGTEQIIVRRHRETFHVIDEQGRSSEGFDTLPDLLQARNAGKMTFKAKEA